jgi:hypothetical protein
LPYRKLFIIFTCVSSIACSIDNGLGCSQGKQRLSQCHPNPIRNIPLLSLIILYRARKAANMARPAPTTGRPASPVPVAEAEALAAELEAELAELEAEELALDWLDEAEAAVPVVEAPESVAVEDADAEPVVPEAEPVVVAEPEADVEADADAELELAEAEAEPEAEMLPETEALGQRVVRSDWADLSSSALQFLAKQSAPLAMMVLMFLQIHVMSMPWQSVPLRDWARHEVCVANG